MRYFAGKPALVLIFSTLSIIVSCGGGSDTQTISRVMTSSTVNVTVSDPATCAPPQGPYSHIYLTIADVRANTSATATGTDTGWVDLTPNLKSSPVQIDLLSNSAIQCSLPALATGTPVTSANFQSINVILLDNSSGGKVANNRCGAVANCVVLATNNSVEAIAISGESQSGISVPPAQIANGSFTVGSNQTKTLNLSVDSCASIVVQADGQLRLKPVIFAGDTSLASSIAGRVVDGNNLGMITGGNVVVALEQKDAATISRVLQATVPDSTGAFTFCSLPNGTYDVVATATNWLNVGYGATLAADVASGTNLGNLPIYPQTGASQAPASITGQITTAGSSGGVSTDLSVSALQAATIGTNTAIFTVPQVLPPSATLAISTAASTSCPSGTDCVTYTLIVPAANPYYRNFSTSDPSYVQSQGDAPFSIDVFSFIAGSGNLPNCTFSELRTNPIKVSGGTAIVADPLTFVGCH